MAQKYAILLTLESETWKNVKVADKKGTAGNIAPRAYDSCTRLAYFLRRMSSTMRPSWLGMRICCGHLGIQASQSAQREAQASSGRA